MIKLFSAKTVKTRGKTCLSIFTFVLVLFIAQVGQACPCGCGAVNPQVMYPGEVWKAFSSVTHDSNFQAVMANGELGDENGPTAKNTLMLALARAVTSEVSITFSLPLEQNYHHDYNTNYAITDPSFSARWSVLPQSFVSPFIPSIQLFGTYKHSVSNSIYDFERNDLMDVHGNGLNEFVPGVDFWFGMTDYKFGLTQTLILPFARKVKYDLDEEVTLKPGYGQKTALSGGYNYPGKWQILGVLELESRRRNEVSGTEVADSEKLVHNAGINGSYSLAPRRTLGLAYKRTAAFANNKNTTRADGVTLSLMQAF